MRKRAQDQLQEEMKTWLQQETEQMKRKLADLRYTDDPLSVLKSLSGKDPVQILVSVYDTCTAYLNSVQKYKMTEFFRWAIKDQTVRHLFLLSIYKGAYSADKLMPGFFQEMQSSSAMSESCPQQHQMLYKSEGTVPLRIKS